MATGREWVRGRGGRPGKCHPGEGGLPRKQRPLPVPGPCFLCPTQSGGDNPVHPLPTGGETEALLARGHELCVFNLQSWLAAGPGTYPPGCPALWGERGRWALEKLRPCLPTVSPDPGGPTHMVVVEVIAGRVHDHDDLRPCVTAPPPGVRTLPAPLQARRDVDVHARGPADLERLRALRY